FRIRDEGWHPRPNPKLRSVSTSVSLLRPPCRDHAPLVSAIPPETLASRSARPAAEANPPNSVVCYPPTGRENLSSKGVDVAFANLPGPPRVQIQTQSGCNARCVFCPNGDVLKSDLSQGRMPESLFQKIVDELAETKPRRI